MHLQSRAWSIGDFIACILDQGLNRVTGGEAHDQLNGIAEIDQALDQPGQTVFSRRIVWFEPNALRANGRFRLADQACVSARCLQFEFAKANATAF